MKLFNRIIMTTKKNVGLLFLYLIVNALLLFGLSGIISQAGSLYLRLELAGFLLVSLLTLIGILCYYRPCGRKVFFCTSLMHIGNLMLIWYFYDTLYLVLLVLALLLFVLSMPRKKSCCCCCPSVPAEQEIGPENIPEMPEKAEEKPAVKPAVQFIPGKYLASKRSNVFHEPKCDWAKKINKSRKLWFASKEEAFGQGFKAHDCVK